MNAVPNLQKLWQEQFGLEDEENTVLIKRTLRSGQRMNYQGNVVVLGDVNPGAEIIAGGNVLVLGQLRGMVQAGACGNENAVIMAFRLKPMQLRIAGHITRSPDDDEADQDFPEIASIQNGVITIEPFV